MKIAILGGTRGIGRELVRGALEHHHEVTVLARQPSRMPSLSDQVEIIAGDALDRAAIARLMQGQDAVCSCLGVPITRQPVALFSRSTEHLLAEISAEQNPRLLIVTGIGAGDSRGHGGFLYDKIVQPLVLKTIYEDKDRQEAMLRNSSANWTIIRPGALTNGARRGEYRVIEKVGGRKIGRISRADVAAFMVAEIEQPEHERRTVHLCY